MAKRGPIAAAMRFAMSVPGQILANTAAFTLPQELRMERNWRVLDIGCGRAGSRACWSIGPGWSGHRWG